MLLILPCAGESSRFPGVRPKWLLTQPNGNLMVCDAIRNLDLSAIDKIVLIALQKFTAGNEERIKRAFSSAGISHNVEIFSLNEKTNSQPETVTKYLETLSSDVSFFIKDCDNQFTAVLNPENEIVLANVSSAKRSDVTNKSYCIVNDNLEIISIAEKKIISETFCVGGYSFRSSRQFVESFNEIKHLPDLYVSHVISHMMLNKNAAFFGKTCDGYEDWGTLEDWLSYKSTFKTLFVDIDGVIVKNSSEFFDPMWGETDALHKNVQYLRNIKKDGRTQLVLTTARSSNFRSQTEEQLERIGVEYDHIIFDLLHAKRLIVNDFSNSNPYPSCDSICLERDSDNLNVFDKKIKGGF